MRLSTIRILSTAATLALCTTSASAQGANSCANAQAISGTSTYAFDTTSATTDGHPEGKVDGTVPRQIENDVWFRWVAPSTSVYTISTDHPATNGATFLAVYRYGCSSTQGRAYAAQGMDPGYVCSTLDLGTEAGTEYLIRIGNTIPSNHTVGSFWISETTPPGILATEVYAGNGRSYHFLEPSSWNVAQTAAVLLGGNLVTVNDQAEQDWLKQTFHNWGGQARSFWLGYNDAETEGNWVWVSGETPGYENWSPPSPNNGNEYEHYAHFRSDWSDGTWNDLIGFPGSGFFYDEVHGVVEMDGGPGTQYCPGDGSGTACPCANNNNGSSGGCDWGNPSFPGGGVLEGLGSNSMAASDAYLVATGIENNFGIFFGANNAVNGGDGNPLNDGLRCAGGGLVRLTPPTTASGNQATTPWPVQTLDIAAASGITRRYQYWFRTPTGPCGHMANLTNGYEIVWQP